MTAFFMKLILNEPQQSVFSYVMQTLTEETYLVGGYVRDALLHRPSDDLDFATAMDPEAVHALFPNALFFARYGTVSFRQGSVKVTLASMRKEEDYIDFRHPSKVTFLKDYRIDSFRRDFTINALYVDAKGNILDPTGKGISDLEHGVLRMIGDPLVRLQEDPLRILRAYRFSYKLGFSLEEELKDAIASKKSLLEKLNPQKVKEELRKCPEPIQASILATLGL